MTDAPRGADPEPVTVAIARRARVGQAAALGAWCDALVALASADPGHRGAGVLRPNADDGEWIVVARYASAQDLARWRASPAFADALARVEPIAEGPARVAERHGLEPFFDLPGTASPPRWKMAAATWLGIYPLALALGAITAPLVGTLPIPLRTLANTAILVPLMTWVVMPALTRALRRWLFA